MAVTLSRDDQQAGGYGLLTGAVGVLPSTAISLASTAPAYSIAVSVGLLVAAVGSRAPLALALSAVPVVLVVLCFRELNRTEPDCGTVFAWTDHAFGRVAGWMVGWVSLAACVLVMSNLAQVAAVYAYTLVGAETWAGSRVAQAGLGVLVIAGMAWSAHRGIRVAVKVQVALVTVELVGLAYFVVSALSAGGAPPLSDNRGGGQWGVAFLAAVFLYWGWDSSFSLNEESTEPRRTPGAAALLATGVLVFTYVTVTYAATVATGTDRLADARDDDFFAALGGELLGSTGSRLLVLAVLASALASTQTTIVPATRTVLGMARRRALPTRLAGVSPRYRTPGASTWAFGAASAVLYSGLVLTSDAVLSDSVAATAVLIALYYVAVAAAVPAYFRRDLRGPRHVLVRVVVPVLAVTAFVAALVLAVADMTVVSLVVVALVLVVGAVVRTFAAAR